MKKIWIMAIAALALVAAGAAIWWYVLAPEPVTVPNTTAVVRGDVQETVLATGVLEASTLVSVGAQVSGQIDTLYVTLGQEVIKGDPIADIDSLDQENAVKSAKASLANMEAQLAAQEVTLTSAQKALSRGENLLAQNLISQADYDALQAEYESAQAQIKALEAQIEQATLSVDSAELDLSRTSITAPISGTVVAVVVEEGQTLSAAQSAPTIVKIANLDSMLIKAEISEADVIRVQPGQRVYFTILGDPDTEIEATLLSVDPAPASIETSDEADTGSAVYYNGTFEVPNEDHTLRISMTAEVTIVIDEATDALVVPSSALGEMGADGGSMVQVYDPETGVLEPRPVTVGLDNNVLAEITDGVSEDELVVSNAASFLPSDTDSSTAAGPGMGGGPGMMGF